jgi:hypothetical protein
VALFRDLDSRPSLREVEAVKEWLQSKHVFHVMRDHPGHDMPMLAGMWGVKVAGQRPALRAVFLEMLHNRAAFISGEILKVSIFIKLFFSKISIKNLHLKKIIRKIRKISLYHKINNIFSNLV